MERTSDEAPSAQSVNYTRTGRIAKSKKGLKVHHCDCGRSYTRAEHLRRHQRNHAQDALVCDYPECGKPFYRLDLLQRHQERHNESENSPPRSPEVGDRAPPSVSAIAQEAPSLPSLSSSSSSSYLTPISWTDPFSESPKLHNTPVSDYANLFANPPYAGRPRTRTDSNASFAEPWSYPSRSPTSSGSAMPYTWSSITKSPSTAEASLSYMSTSYPMTSLPLTMTSLPLTEQMRIQMMPPDLDPMVKQQLLKVPEAQFRQMTTQFAKTARQNNMMSNGFFPGDQPLNGQPLLSDDPTPGYPTSVSRTLAQRDEEEQDLVFKMLGDHFRTMNGSGMNEPRDEEKMLQAGDEEQAAAHSSGRYPASTNPDLIRALEAFKSGYLRSRKQDKDQLDKAISALITPALEANLTTTEADLLRSLYTIPKIEELRGGAFGSFTRPDPQGSLGVLKKPAAHDQEVEDQADRGEPAILDVPISALGAPVAPVALGALVAPIRNDKGDGIEKAHVEKHINVTDTEPHIATIFTPQSLLDPELVAQSQPPVPSDSGYHSGHPSDTNSVCSMSSMGGSLGLPENFLEGFISFFGDTLIEKAGGRHWAEYTLATRQQKDMEREMNALLKDYTIDLWSQPIDAWVAGSEGVGAKDATQASPVISERNRAVLVAATRLIRRYRPKITRYFHENAASSPHGNPVSLSERLKNLGQQLSLMERLGLFTRSGTQNADLEQEGIENEDEDDEEDFDVQVLADLEPIRDMLVASDAFARMASRLRRTLYHDDMREMEAVRSIIKSKMWGKSVFFDMDWALPEFMLLQYGEDVPSIGSVIVITGSSLYAQAMTCEEYIKQTWPRSGMMLVHALDAALKNKYCYVRAPADKNVQDPYKAELNIRILNSATVSATFSVFSEDLAVELGQQLVWLGSVLSTSPLGDDVVYARPMLDPSPYSPIISVKYQHKALHAAERACWLPLFSGAVIASGFPVLERRDEIGLELPLELLAGLAGVQHAVEHKGGVVMKGYSHMFVPVRKTDDRVQWHAVSSGDADTYLSYADGISKCGPRALKHQVSLDDIRKCRAIVGWCSVAESRLGSRLANYENIHYSAAVDAESPLRCDEASLGFQNFGSAALKFKFGAKEGKCHLKRDGPYRNIVNLADKTPIVLYDTADRRGWLVPTSHVLLHIWQCRHQRDPFQVGGKRIALDTDVSGTASAKEILHKHMSVRLSDDDDDDNRHTFKTEIANIWSILESLIAENVDQEQKTSGAALQGRWTEVLKGFEFNGVVEQHSPFRQKQIKLANSNGGWPLLTREIDALVLLANGFEDIIVPAAAAEDRILCRSWQRVPREKDYLATTTTMLKTLYERAGHPLDRKYLTSTSTKLQWHCGDSVLFGPCKRVRQANCKCNRLQQILQKSAVGTIVPPGHLEDRGAVIFGRSSGSSIAHDVLTRPRAASQKHSSLYTLENVPLTPIVIGPQDLEGTSVSDGDLSAQSGSDGTIDSMPSSLSSCTTLSTRDMASPLCEARATALSDSFSRKRQRLPGIRIWFDDDDKEDDDGDDGEEDDPDEYVLIRRKRLKGAPVQNASPYAILKDDKHDNQNGAPFSQGQAPVLAPSLVGVQDDPPSKRVEPASLTMRLAEPVTERGLRRQHGFYRKTEVDS